MAPSNNFHKREQSWLSVLQVLVLERRGALVAGQSLPPNQPRTEIWQSQSVLLDLVYESQCLSNHVSALKKWPYAIRPLFLSIARLLFSIAQYVLVLALL